MIHVTQTSGISGAEMRDREIVLAKALGLTPTEKTRVERSLDGNKHWWILGCAEGGHPLPMTDGAATLPEALDRAEAWLAPEIYALSEPHQVSPAGEGYEESDNAVIKYYHLKAVGGKMAASNVQALFKHQGHRLALVYYGHPQQAGGATLECETCYEVLLEFKEKDGVIEIGPTPDPLLIKERGTENEPRE